jgi:DNA polymerase III delta prime subunit
MEHIMEAREDFLWTEKYRPKTIDECILPDNMKHTFNAFIEQGDLPNLILSGGPGVGKTTVAKAVLDQLGRDYMFINGSLEGRNIDTLRTTIKDYASTVSFSEGRKYVILDEADYLNAQSTQPALRNFMEEYSKNCGFILTCNFKNRIIDPLQSRCSIIDFKIDNKEKPNLAALLFKRVLSILDENDVEYNKKVVAELIQKSFPDYRRVLNTLQQASTTGAIDTGTLTSTTDDLTHLVGYLKNKEFTEMRKWVAENSDVDVNVLFRKFYDQAYQHMKSESIPQLVVHLADYQYKSAFAVDQEINLVALLTHVMMDCDFK